MDRRDFFGCIGRMLMVGAVTAVAAEILEPEPQQHVEQCITDDEWKTIHWEKPSFMLAS